MTRVNRYPFLFSRFGQAIEEASLSQLSCVDQWHTQAVASLAPHCASAEALVVRASTATPNDEKINTGLESLQQSAKQAVDLHDIAAAEARKLRHQMLEGSEELIRLQTRAAELSGLADRVFEEEDRNAARAGEVHEDQVTRINKDAEALQTRLHTTLQECDALHSDNRTLKAALKDDGKAAVELAEAQKGTIRGLSRLASLLHHALTARAVNITLNLNLASWRRHTKRHRVLNRDRAAFLKRCGGTTCMQTYCAIDSLALMSLLS